MTADLRAVETPAWLAGDDATLRDEWADCKPFIDICRGLGRRASDVMARARALGLPSRTEPEPGWLVREAYGRGGIDTSLDVIRRLGIDAKAAVASSPLGLTTIQTDGAFWEPAERGREAFTVPVWAPGGRISDLLAVSAEGDRWWSRTGLADAVLDEGAISRARITGKALYVFAGPLEWVHWCRGGAVILDWSTHLPFYFAGIERIVCTDAALSRRLGDTLRRQARPPKIRALEYDARTA